MRSVFCLGVKNNNYGEVFKIYTIIYYYDVYMYWLSYIVIELFWPFFYGHLPLLIAFVPPLAYGCYYYIEYY